MLEHFVKGDLPGGEKTNRELAQTLMQLKNVGDAKVPAIYA